MPNEIESKHRVKDFRAIRQALDRLGATFVGTVVETDSFYDTAGASLRGSDRGLRIRMSRKVAGPKGFTAPPPLVTFKGPRQPGSKLKVRREIQTPLDGAAGAKALGELFAQLGYAPTIKVRKQRSSYRLGPCKIELDQLARIGRFVEIEGPTAKSVIATCRKLGLIGPSITTSYVSMVAALAL